MSVVMPVRDEADHLEAAVAAVRAQEYPGSVEICLAVAPSNDGTERVARALAIRHDRVTFVENPAGTTPAGLNAAINSTSGEVIVRVDGHAQLSPGYIGRAVETLRRTGAANVGGIQRAEGVTPFEQAVAAAMTSRFGTGDATFHYGGDEGPTDTVYLGVFDRGAVEAAGLFDETLVRNQDYELNIRLRAAGGTVWFDPELWARYRPRGSLRALADPVLRVRAVEAGGGQAPPAVVALAPGGAPGAGRRARRQPRRGGVPAGRPRRARALCGGDDRRRRHRRSLGAGGGAAGRDLPDDAPGVGSGISQWTPRPSP